MKLQVLLIFSAAVISAWAAEDDAIAQEFRRFRTTSIPPTRWPKTRHGANKPFPGGHKRSLSQIQALAKSSLPTAMPVPTSIASWGDCDGEWHNYNGFCYKWTGEDVKSNWFASELKCRSSGGHLVSIENDEESQVVQGITLCKNEYWLGLVNTDYENGLFVKKEGWSWWDRSQHNNTRLTVANKAGMDCAYGKVDGKWVNDYCSHRSRSSVCKKPFAPVSETSPNRPKFSRCPKDWVYYNNDCYFFSNTTVNYFHAQLYCLDYQAHVVTVHSKQEQAFLQAINGCENKFWIGIERANPCVTDATGKHCWEWNDLTFVQYQNWLNKKPTANDVECAYSDGYWENNLPCITQLRFVCKREARV